MLITKYKFQIILFSFYTFQTFQVHPHRIIISHFPCYDSGVVVSHPVTRKAVGNHPDNPVVFVRTFAVADCDLTACTDQEIYLALLDIVREQSAEKVRTSCSKAL